MVIQAVFICQCPRSDGMNLFSIFSDHLRHLQTWPSNLHFCLCFISCDKFFFFNSLHEGTWWVHKSTVGLWRSDPPPKKTISAETEIKKENTAFSFGSCPSLLWKPVQKHEHWWGIKGLKRARKTTKEQLEVGSLWPRCSFLSATCCKPSVAAVYLWWPAANQLKPPEVRGQMLDLSAP